MELQQALSCIQSELNAKKSKFNSFGKYNYRSCEDILEALKPLLKKTSACLTITDDLINFGERFYIKATAKLTLGNESIETSALAREAHLKKGMDESQITGATSSYARKQALCGLFAIDDGIDADSTNKHEEVEVDHKKQSVLLASLEAAAQKGTAAMGEYWKSIPISDQKLIGVDNKRRIYNSIEKKSDEEFIQTQCE